MRVNRPRFRVLVKMRGGHMRDRTGKWTTLARAENQAQYWWAREATALVYIECDDGGTELVHGAEPERPTLEEWKKMAEQVTDEKGVTLGDVRNDGVQ